jgi:NDP-sugar pyrophosphorylase family protein
MIDQLVIIPTARLVPIELQTEFGPIPTAMIPVDGRPALLHILAQYPASSHVIIGVDQGAEEVSSYVEHHLKKLPISLVNVGSTSSLGETILRCLQAVTTLPKHLIINFGEKF